MARFRVLDGMKVLVLPLLAVLCVAGCGKGGDKKDAAKSMSAPVAVKVADVVKKTLPIEIRTFGTVEASASVAVKAQVGGLLTNVSFQEGQEVEQDALLFSIDSRPADAALKQAEASLARDVVQQKNASTEATRQEELLKKGLTSQETRDQACTTAEMLASSVQADEAARDKARLELAYCSIRAPIGGRTGKRMVDAGNLVRANDQTLVTVNRIQPVYVAFSIPQRELPALRKRTGNESLPVRVLVPGETERPETGSLTFVDNAVNPDTGTVQLRGTFANDSARLWPGQFVSVILTLAVQQDATVVPAAAVLTGQKGTYVFVVKDDKTAEIRPITVERTVNDETVVSAGLTPGERVVTDGQFRLGPGSTVEAKAGTSREPVATP